MLTTNAIGVGRKSATSVGLTTDLVHWLHAGKTVVILRCAAESTDLLPPSTLPRSLRSLRLSPPSRPAAGQLAAAAAHCAAGSNRDDSAAGGCRLRAFCQRGCRCVVAAGVGVSLIPYQKTSHLLSYLCISVSAIGDFETFDDSRLRRNFASVVCGCRCKASVVGHSLRPGAALRCEGGKSVSCGR